MTIICKLLYRK